MIVRLALNGHDRMRGFRAFCLPLFESPVSIAAIDQSLDWVSDASNSCGIVGRDGTDADTEDY
jgi:hypothetical protein